MKENAARWAGHTLGFIVVLYLSILAVRGFVLLDMELHPCEVPIIARRADVKQQRPGGRVRITGVYEIKRDGCTARFYPVVAWITDFGTMQTPYSTHAGSFDVTYPTGPQQVGREYTIPLEAIPGTPWVSRVSADWDRWRLPFGLSVVEHRYREVAVQVVE